MNATMSTYQRFPIELIGGHDFHLIDQNGKSYVDLTAGIGVCNFGYSNCAIQQAATQQISQLWHISNLYQNPLAEEVAELLCPADYQAFFCNSGTEANEAALKLAFKVASDKSTKQPKEIVAFNYGFHGRTIGSLSVTGYPHIQEGFDPLLPHVKMVDYNQEQSLTAINENTAAVILEVIQGEGGVNVGHQQWLQAVQAQCQATQTLLIVDEVQTGMGRTGYQFAYQQFGLEPDIITVAKGLANGLPVGAMLAKKNVAKHFKIGDHGTTFGGNLVAMAAAKEVLQQLTPTFLTSVQAKGAFLMKLLEQEIAPLAQVKAVSGAGLMIGIHLTEEVPVNQVITSLQKTGYLTLSARGNTLRLLPPLVIDESHLKQAVEAIKLAIATQS